MGAWWRESSIPRHLLDQEKDQGWDWVKLADGIQREQDSEEGTQKRCCVAITAENRTLFAQGAIFYRLDALSLEKPGLPAVYVEWVASAPRNRRNLVGKNAAFTGTGENLVAIAIADSIYNGFDGRVLLKPLDTAVEFYKKMRFEKVLDPADGRSYYEIGGEMAKAHIRLRGWKL